MLRKINHISFLQKRCSWVFSNELPSSERANHAIYQTSPQNQMSGETWDISYGDGSGAGGKVYADTVVIGK